MKIMYNNRIALVVALTVATSADAFTGTPAYTRSATSLQETPNSMSETAETVANDVVTSDDVVASDAESPPPAMKAQTTEPPNPAVSTKKKKKAAPRKPAHKDGVFSPVVNVAKKAMGQDELNKLRGKVIAMHSDAIKGFVDTSDSKFGQSVLKGLFKVADTDHNGIIDEGELDHALQLLGFNKFLKPKQVKGIFARADVNEDGSIDREEFMKEAPKTLRVNLVKLAKQNGADMGLLS